MKYFEITSSILSEDARRKTFLKNSPSEAYIVQSTGDRPQHRGRSSLHRANTTRNRSKSRDLRTCNYCKKPRHIKANCRAHKAKNDKFQRKGNREEVNYCGHLLRIHDAQTELFQRMIQTSSPWRPWPNQKFCLLDSGASYHIIPFRLQF
jgi:hypothetical protein